jgi:hypothetical protein
VQINVFTTYFKDMRKIYLLLSTICCFITFTGLCQTRTDSIEIKKSFGTVFRQQGRNLTPQLLTDIVKNDPEAYKEMQQAKTNHTVATVFNYAGGFLVGYPLGTTLAGGKANWKLAGIGAGLLAISIPFTAGYTKHAVKAINNYNSSVVTSLNKLDVKLRLSGQGLCMQLRF